MSSGSSNIDPSEFNEPTVDVLESPIRVSHIAQDPETELQRTSSRSSHQRGSNGHGRRLRQRVVAPPIGNQCRIWIYQPMYEPHPNRHALNRIIFSIARALRTRRSVPAQPGQRPGVIYRRNADMITIDVERDMEREFYSRSRRIYANNRNT
ncbi:uncharacterized protein [Drosophila virilis]|uniref:Uncharacterized protein, isoform A n=2 Tax=Drosophila virilis TaxID=7244 RepID=B4LKN4_DROVI|nr:uncharacterized protein LOC6626521 isoform X1 [Drosophila virilis]XP_015030050.1 uncharacterized protein LOC6626521 isoform X1 [Drosophila virilis]XP_015030052.1 uncharacterized protein LOC6626521 isoform X1 [Drosophila virilis]XP_032292396.1 uncharacterized protein LOC6626521 isoform X1 [Drosophila virilis]EDW61757.2 uncharacterized protein Dvir_GJ22221, isoform A [Drosophila virilis]KRF80219.1 uncharacterized protein Dvir_GJ22221, isoform B [Drosophila virilis]KRF80221.1 uncharacterized 